MLSLLKRVMLTTIATAIICCGISPVCAAAPATEKLRVAFPLHSGFCEIDENGNYSGYTYEYLQEIAQYTHWEYEFLPVEGNDNEAIMRQMDMLESGEIDIMGGLLQNDELAKMYDYPTYPYAVRYDQLCVLPQSPLATQNDIYYKNPLRVAVYGTAKVTNKRLCDYADKIGLAIEQVPCLELEAQKAALVNGDADALWTPSMGRIEGLISVARTNEMPVYFATTPTKKHLVRKLQAALANIEDNTPLLSARLSQKYFNTKTDGIILSPEEQKYIDENPTVQVAFSKANSPAQSYNSVTGTYSGIAVDLLNYLKSETGLNLVFLAPQAEESDSAAINKGADIIAQIQYDYGLAQESGLVFSRQYISSPLVIAANKNINAQNLSESKLAVSKSLVCANTYNSPEQSYGTLRQALSAVENGEADYTYAPNHIVQYIFSDNEYPHINVVTVPDEWVGYCFGISRTADPRLLTIVNKAITNIPAQLMQDILYRNTLTPAKQITFSSFVRANLGASICVGGAAVLIIICSLTLLLASNRRHARQSALANERYMQLSELASEYMFEYDFKNDSLRVSDSVAETYKMPKLCEHYGNYVKSHGTSQEKTAYAALGSGLGTSCEICMDIDGENRWFSFFNKVVKDERENPVFVIGKFKDITREKQEQEALYKKAHSDSLTGLRNVENMRINVKEHLASLSADAPCALYVMDVDKFKEINDNYGHYNGDIVLTRFADVMREVFGQSGYLGRCGGDEFVVCQDVSGTEQAAEYCMELLRKAREIIVDEKSDVVTVSIGVAMAEVGDSYGTLYKKADDALYSVKNTTRNNFRIV